MRFVTYVSPFDNRERAGLLVDDQVHSLPAGTELIELLRTDALAEAGAAATSSPDEVVPLAAVRLLPPIPRPPTIRDSCSFEQHLRTSIEAKGLPFNEDWFEHPMMYFTSPYGLTGPGDLVTPPQGASRIDFELEVAAVVGRAGHDLDAREARSHIAGFVTFNDWSARDIQVHESGFKVGPFKTKDWAMSIGPWFVTTDELDPHRLESGALDLRMTADVNGRRISDGSLADMYWTFEELVAYSSWNSGVRPGDLIGSGTVGSGCLLEQSLRYGSQEYPWLEPGDEVALEVEGLGRLVNRVGARSSTPSPLRPDVKRPRMRTAQNRQEALQ